MKTLLRGLALASTLAAVLSTVRPLGARPFTACSRTYDPCFTDAACPPVDGKPQVCSHNIICP